MKAVNICKSFGDNKILENFSFDFPENSFTVIKGRSGRGKTTLLRILSGLEKPDSGEVIADERRKSFIFQENRLLENAGVLDNLLAFGCAPERSERFLTETGLYDKRNERAASLSGGEKRRLSLARCLAFGGDIYFLDEPLRELDGETLEKMMKLLKSETNGKTVIAVSHDEIQIEYFADNICALD